METLPLAACLFLSISCGFCDHGRDLSWMRFVHGVAGALDFNRMALRPCVIPALKIGIDDLIVPGDDSPARLRLPRGRGQRCDKDLGRGQHLRARRKLRPVARQIGREQLGKLRRVESPSCVFLIAPLVLARTLGVFLPSAPSSSPTSGACAAT